MNLNKEIYIPKPSKNDPDALGHFGKFGGRYVPETLMPALEQLRLDYEAVRFDADFWKEVDYYYKNYVGRPSALYFAQNISNEVGANVYLKREDLNHTGAHKINNTIAQAILAKRLGKKKVIAETGAGSMVSLLQPLRHFLDSNVKCSWVQKMWRVKSSMSFG